MLTCRTVDGLKPLVRMLERSSTPAVVAAALDALRAVCLNNDENKAKVNTSWLIPQLVKLMGAKARPLSPDARLSRLSARQCVSEKLDLLCRRLFVFE